MYITFFTKDADLLLITVFRLQCLRIIYISSSAEMTQSAYWHAAKAFNQHFDLRFFRPLVSDLSAP
jgi:hypothetical protein